MKSWIRRHSALLLACTIACTLATHADAAFQVTFKATGGADKTITDGGAGDNDGLANGSIVVISETVGAYTFNVTLTKTNSPGGAIAFVEHGTNSIEGTGAATIEIVASANDFDLPVTPPDLNAISGATAQFLAGTTNTNSADVSYAAYVDTANALSTSGVGTLVGSDGPVTIAAPGGNANLSDQQIITSLSAKYALNLMLTAVLNDAGTNRIDLDGTLELTPVPVPAGIVLAMSALPVLGLGYLRRRKATKAETVA